MANSFLTSQASLAISFKSWWSRDLGFSFWSPEKDGSVVIVRRSQVREKKRANLN